MSISSKLLFPVAYDSSETDTCYSAVFKRLLSLFCSEGQPVNSFLPLNINYMLFDEILSGEKQLYRLFRYIIMPCPLSS